MKNVTLLVLLALSSTLAAQRQYPITKTVDHVDTYHGPNIADPDLGL